MAVVIHADITTDGVELERAMKRDTRVIESRMGNAFKSVGRIASTTFKGIAVAGQVLGRSLLAPLRILTSMRAAIGATLGGLAIDRFIRNAAALELRTKALAFQLGITEHRAGRLIGRINAASAGMLDFAKASELANQAGILDIPNDKLERLVQVFTLLAVSRGREDSIGPDLEELLNSIARGEPPKRFGIFVGAEELQGLKLAEKQLLTMNRTIEELEKRARRLGLEGKELFLTYNSIFGNIKDIVGEVGRWALKIDVVRDAIEYIAELTGNILAGLQSDQGGDIAKAILISMQQVGPALIATLGNLLEKGFKLGAAALLEALGTLDFVALGKSVAAAIGRGIQAIAPRLAQLLGIDEDVLAAAEKASGNVFQKGAAGLRESAGKIDTLGPIRDLIGDIMHRFTPIEPGRDGDLYGVGIKAIDLGKVTPQQIGEAKQRLKEPFADRFNRILEEMLSDPEIGDKYEKDPSSRRQIRKIAQEKAIAELEADKVLAGFSSPAILKRITDAQDAIAKNPKNAGLIQDELGKYLLSTLTEAQRRFLDDYNRRASSTDPKLDPIGIIRGQMNLPPDASFGDIIGSIFGIKKPQGSGQGEQSMIGLPGDAGDQASEAVRKREIYHSNRVGGEAEQAVRRMVEPPGTGKASDTDKQRIEEQNQLIKQQNGLMEKNVEALQEGVNILTEVSNLLDRFTTAMG